MSAFKPMTGATFTSSWRRLQREEQRSLFIVFVPALALFFIMGFRSSPMNDRRALAARSVHISSLHSLGAHDAGGGHDCGETPKVGAQAAKRHRAQKMVEAEIVPEAADIAPAVAEASEPDEAAPEQGDEGNAGEGDSGVGGGQGGGVGNGGGFGDGVQGRGAEDKTQLPEPISKDWGCEWPWFTDIKDAIVEVRVSVNKLGRAYDVEIVSSNHHEFDQVAATCALHARYRAGVDKDGKAMQMDTKNWPIHFTKYVAGEK